MLVELGALLALLPAMPVLACRLAALQRHLALVPALPAVVDILAQVLLAPVAPDVAVAVTPPVLARGLLAVPVLALADGVRHLLAALAALAAVPGVVADVRLTAVAVLVVVAVSPAGLAGVHALEVLALGGGVGKVELALLAAVAAVVDVGLDTCITAGLVGVAVLEPGWAFPRIGTSDEEH